jgi:hypothetical protein
LPKKVVSPVVDPELLSFGNRASLLKYDVWLVALALAVNDIIMIIMISRYTERVALGATIVGASRGHRETPSIAIVLYDCHVSTNRRLSPHKCPI